jgi:hypothetical protein
MIVLELDGQLSAAGLDMGTAGRPALVQPGVDTDDLPDRPLRRVGAGPFSEPDPQGIAKVLLKRGVVGFRRGDVGFEQHPTIDGQPASVEGLHLVRHRHVGVQIGVAGPAVAVGERGANQAPDVDLPDPLRPGPGEQGILLDERQSVLHGSLMGPFDHSRHHRISDRPQGRHRLHWGERQIIASNCLCLRPRVFRDLSRQLPGINRLPAMRGQEELPGHLGPHPRPVCGGQGSARRQAGRGLDRREAYCHFEAERADVAINDLERRPEPGRVLVVAFGKVGSFQLLLAELGQRV